MTSKTSSMNIEWETVSRKSRKVKQDKEKTEKVYEKAGIILIYDNGDILLIKGCYSRKWGFPKGLIEHGETPWVTAIREMVYYFLKKKIINSP